MSFSVLLVSPIIDTQRAVKQSRDAPCDFGSGRKYKTFGLPKEDAERAAGAPATPPGERPDGVLVLMPTRGTISVETYHSLQRGFANIPHVIAAGARKDIVTARNLLAKMAVDAISKNPIRQPVRETFALWVDDDAWWAPETVSVMLQAMQQLPMLDALFGKFGTRMPGSKVLAWRDRDDMESFAREFVDCKQGEVVPIERAGFHFVLMRLRLLQKLGPDPFTPPTDESGTFVQGEDMAFCDRAIDAGAKLAVGMGMPIVHVDPRDGAGYLPGMPQMYMDGDFARVIEVAPGAIRSYGEGLPAVKAVDGSQLNLADDLVKRRALFATGGAV